MASHRLFVWLQRTSRLARFSLRTFLVLLTLASVAFSLWWQRPIQLDRVPQELGTVPAKSYECATSYWQTALWTEEAPRDKKFVGQDPFDSDPRGGPIFAAAGKCWARRNGWSNWQLHGPAEVFTKDNQCVIRAECAAGKLHGEFRSWFTSGKLREEGEYVRGKKHGVWRLHDQFRDKVRAEQVFKHGVKEGIWVSGLTRSTYHRDKLRLREESHSNGGDWTITEYDAAEEPLRITYWNADRTQQLGVDHFVAGQPDGIWFRLVFENQRPVYSRGQWQQGLAVGEWVYESHLDPPRRLLFEDGALVAINGEWVVDLLIKSARSYDDEHQSLVRKFSAAADFHVSFERKEGLDSAIGYGWPPLCIDPQLRCSQEELDAIWDDPQYEFFCYENLPASAAIVLALRGTNLIVDYRLGALWLTTPQLAAQWRDETNAKLWFGKIANTPWRHEEIEGVFLTVESPSMQRELHFGEGYECRTQWEEARQLEFRQPITCSLGTARRVAGRYDPARLSLKLPEFTFEESLDQFAFDERLAIECEIRHCRLMLRGDTLVMEPR